MIALRLDLKGLLWTFLLLMVGRESWDCGDDIETGKENIP